MSLFCQKNVPRQAHRIKRIEKKTMACPYPNQKFYVHSRHIVCTSENIPLLICSNSWAPKENGIQDGQMLNKVNTLRKYKSVLLPQAFDQE
jgi:hypothetical protein